MKKRRKYTPFLATIWLEKHITRRFPPGERKAGGVGQVKHYRLFIGHIISENRLVIAAEKPK